jgi:hypothetical protein
LPLATPTRSLTIGRGKPLTIKLTGELKQGIEKGSKVEITAKLGMINIHKTFDLCEQLQQHKGDLEGGDELKCPFKAEKKTWQTTVTLPDKAIPAVSDTCLQA